MGSIKLQFTKTQEQRLQSLERRISSIAGRSVPSTINLIKKQNCVAVKRCLENNTCYNYTKYFQINEHNINTRNNNIMIKLPRYKLEYGKKSFKYVAAKWYNELPIQIRTTNGNDFYKKVKDHFNSLDF